MARVGTEGVCLIDESTAERENIDVETVRKRSFSQIPMDRYAEPEEVASVGAFLCSGPNSYVTGSAYCVDGGYVGHV